MLPINSSDEQFNFYRKQKATRKDFKNDDALILSQCWKMRMLCVRAGKITQIERESWIKIYITDDMKYYT